ncbi:hypothetical protein [uncultured Bradyrhizobium sp.]|jgi:hypothetical protein|uniref:hypothetical protein n=1 Tax=uncultured Bradyrhizobium sp. TaxID=199684 RepID=UPI00260CCEDE|nr:hypothetical protein [uncultured Bradyrhizobium sp.]
MVSVSRNAAMTPPEVTITAEQRASAPLDDREIHVLATTFGVAGSDLSVGPHPLDTNLDALAIKFRHGINLPSALAAFFNSDFYDVPAAIDRLDLHYTPNRFAYIDPDDFGLRLFLSVPRDDRAAMIGKITGRSEDIGYVIEHPEILFMMRPNPNYRKARRELEQGYLPAL